MRVLLALLLLAGTASAQTIPPSPQGLTAQFSATCAASTCATWSVGVATSVTVSVTGSGSWTGTWKASSDGGNTYFTATLINLADRTTTTTVTDTQDGQYAIVNSGITHLQFRLTTWASGGANVWAIRGYGSPMALPFSSGGGPLLVNDGTCLAPSYSFLSDPTQGLAKNCLVLNGAILQGDAANILAQRNGTNPQRFNVYGTYTSATSNELVDLEYNTTLTAFALIVRKGSGGGSDRPLYIANETTESITLRTNGANRWSVGASTGNFLPASGVGIGMVVPFAINTAPTIASGGCTSPAVTWSNGTATFLVTIGTSCTGVKTFTLTMPAATNRWAVDCDNNTSDAAQQTNYVVARGTTTTAVVVTSYDRVLGVQEDFTASDTYLCKASGG